MADRPKTDNVVSFEFNNVAHVRPIPAGKTRDQVIAEIVRDKSQHEIVGAAAPVDHGEPPLPKPVPDAKPIGYRVVKADGIGYWDVVDPEGRPITKKSMRKKTAEEMARKKNLEAVNGQKA